MEDARMRVVAVLEQAVQDVRRGRKYGTAAGFDAEKVIDSVTEDIDAAVDVVNALNGASAQEEYESVDTSDVPEALEPGVVDTLKEARQEIVAGNSPAGTTGDAELMQGELESRSRTVGEAELDSGK